MMMARKSVTMAAVVASTLFITGADATLCGSPARSGCVVCTRPTNWAEYLANMSTPGDQSSDWILPSGSWQCAATGQSPNAGVTVTPCSTAGATYTLSGCPTICVAPDPLPSGYQAAASGGVVETNKAFNAATFDVSGYECASGYNLATGETAVTVDVCTSAGGAYALSGCEAADCVAPNPPPSGYQFASGGAVEANLAFNEATFDVSGYECASGYNLAAGETAVTVGVCTSAGGAYTMSGCGAAENSMAAPTSAGFQVVLLLGAALLFAS